MSHRAPLGTAHDMPFPPLVRAGQQCRRHGPSFRRIRAGGIAGLVYETVDAPLGNGHKATLELAPRCRETGEILQSRLLVDFQVADGVMLAAAVTHVALPGGDEWRTHQQMNLKTGPFAFRSRLEQRYFTDADRPQF